MTQQPLPPQPSTSPPPPPPSSPQTTSVPQPQVVQPPQQQKSSTGKVILGICGGCVALFIIGGIIFALLGRTFVNNVIKPAIDEFEVKNVENIDIPPISSDIYSTKLPDDFPKEIPVYTNANVVSYTKSTDGKQITLLLSSSDDVSKVDTWYEKEAKKHGWELVSTVNHPEGGKTSIFQKGKKNLTISTGSNDTGNTLMTTTYSESSSDFK